MQRLRQQTARNSEGTHGVAHTGVLCMQRLRQSVGNGRSVHIRGPHGGSLHAEVETARTSRIIGLPDVFPHGCSLHAEVETSMAHNSIQRTVSTHTGVLCMQRLRPPKPVRCTGRGFHHPHGCSLHAEVETLRIGSLGSSLLPTRVFSACRTVIGAEDRQMSLVEGGQTEYDISSAFLCVYPPSF